MSRRLLIFASPSVTADEVSMVTLSGCDCLLLLLSVEAVVAAVEDGSAAAWGRLLFLFLDFSAVKRWKRERV